MPTDRLSIERDWQVAGICATGSHNLVGADVMVPDSHVLDMARMAAGSSGIAIAVNLFATLLGAARGALDVVAEVLERRRPPGPGYGSLAEFPGAQQYFAESAHRVTPPNTACFGSPRRSPDCGLVSHLPQPTTRACGWTCSPPRENAVTPSTICSTCTA
ncbi:hypothetical protein ACFFQW_03320 [Umezawaea endophytica]|uniref:Uncharacterized protein n=1 Tax=Umezawaea endophytica TaxID=1654476 RepID=A0A9X3AG57_9PSEU|nr:hypothetical protein [Umezawaea endophytica]MCS7479176.1 hypothetical protein [Umezawaea endophytica]